MLTIVTPEGESLTYKGSYDTPNISLISAIRAYKLVKKGCTAYLCAVEITETSGLKSEDIPLV